MINVFIFIIPTFYKKIVGFSRLWLLDWELIPRRLCYYCLMLGLVPQPNLQDK
ncbi:MAG: hypothetical protein F6K62_27120 [Sphaerospermopsis sp. SIO1G2]|nr:hypothetical protein [Sphaerospermopsis sp. SIO1G2]